MNDMENNFGDTQGHVWQQETGEPMPSPGAQLAMRREEMKLTVEQVARQLNLAPRQVEAIEADNYAALPGMVSARGFVRAYAKLVRMDAEPLLAALAPAVAPLPNAMPGRSRFTEKPFAEHRFNFGLRDRKLPKFLIPVAGAIILALGAALAYRMDWLPVFTGFTSEGRQAGAQVMTQPVPAATEPEEVPGKAVEVLPPPVITESLPPSAPAAVPQQVPVPAAGADPVKESGAAATIPADAEIETKEALVLRVTETSWIELKRPDGAVLVSRELPAGTVESFRIRGEVTLTVGNASGVEATLRGKSLDVKSRARNNVARLTLK